jgi:hypothetical protein
VRQKVGKSPKHCVFPMICGSGGSKSSMCFQFLKCLFKVCRIFLDCLVPWASGVHKEVLEVMGQFRDRIVFEHGVQALQQRRSPVDLQLHPKLSPPRRPWAFHQRCPGSRQRWSQATTTNNKM